MIQVHNISKSFEHLKAVDAISFNIKEGEIFGLLGPNGAGKSTTINMMSTLLKVDTGSITINGIDVSKNTQQSKQDLGVVPQEISLYDEFSAYDNLVFWGELYQVPSKELKKRIESLLELIGLSDRKNDLIKNYSGGMKRRINIAAALLHKPKVLFMDEPTVGVDPQSRNRIFEIVETLNKQGMTIVYTSHYMEEIERLCDRIAIIDAGKIIVQGTQNELKAKCTAQEEVAITFKEIRSEQVNSIELLLDLKATLTERTLKVSCNMNTCLSRIINFCETQELTIENIDLHKVNLETVFLELTGKQLRD